MVEALFSPDKVRSIDHKCLICGGILKKRDAVRKLGGHGWKNFKTDAEKWSKVKFPINHGMHTYTEVYQKVRNVDKAFGTVHNSCRAKFGTKVRHLLKSLELLMMSNVRTWKK